MFRVKISHVTVFIMVALLIFNATFLTFASVAYQVNKDYIAKTLCVKRNTKANNCQGKCQLKKVANLAKENENEAQKTSLVIQWESSVFIQTNLDFNIFDFSCFEIKSKNLLFAEDLLKGYFSINTPPPLFFHS